MRKTIVFLFAVILYACSSSHNPQVFHGTVDGLNNPQTIHFRAKEGQKLTATLTTPEPANLRINQIISPSGNADGPFGQDMTYDINETGEWSLIIGGSLMQGDDYKGEYTLTVDLKIP